jgi:hypothetical protein
MNTNSLYLVAFPVLWIAAILALFFFAPKAIMFLTPITFLGWLAWGWKLGEATYG